MHTTSDSQHPSDPPAPPGRTASGRADSRADGTDPPAGGPATGGMLAVDVTGLWCTYGTFEAVRGVDLQTRPGELLAVLGTNGAGKTTLLEALHGQRRPADGTVRVLGLDPYRQRRHLAARTGVMLQDTALPAELTAGEALGLWRRLADGGRDHRPVAASLARVGLTGRRDVRIGRLSGGERRRLSLAVTLSADPELVFLDEPTAGLDPGYRTDAWELIEDLRRRGTTVVLTTHYLQEAETLADRLAILHHGRLAVAGTLQEVLATRRATIRCRIPTGARPPRQRLSGQVTLTPRAGTQLLAVRTPDPEADLRVLLDWSAAQTTPLQDLRTSPASLDDVFEEIR